MGTNVAPSPGSVELLQADPGRETVLFLIAEDRLLYEPYASGNFMKARNMRLRCSRAGRCGSFGR
jgi:hypothetical protein